MSIGLVMIVKDEAAVLGRCLASVRPLIDHWTILDTGSTDGSPEIAESALAGLPGAVHRLDEWQGFGDARTKALQAARGTADYHLMVDADMTTDGFLEALSEPTYLLRVVDGTGFEYRLPLLLQDGHDWVFRGVTHELLDFAIATPLDTLTIFHHMDGSRRPRKQSSDLALLSAEHAANPDDPRATFYLAQTCADLGLIDQAISLYRVRAEMTGWAEETFYARYQLGCLLCEHVSFDEGADELLAAWRLRPGRVEPLRALANASNSVADKTPMTTDSLFVHAEQYA